MATRGGKMAVFSTAATNRPNQSFLFPSQLDPDTFTTTTSRCFFSLFWYYYSLASTFPRCSSRQPMIGSIQRCHISSRSVSKMAVSLSWLCLLLTQVNGESQQPILCERDILEKRNKQMVGTVLPLCWSTFGCWQAFNIQQTNSSNRSTCSHLFGAGLISRSRLLLFQMIQQDKFTSGNQSSFHLHDGLKWLGQKEITNVGSSQRPINWSVDLTSQLRCSVGEIQLYHSGGRGSLWPTVCVCLADHDLQTWRQR